MKYFYNENQERNLRKHYNIERPYAWLSRILLWHGYVSKNNLQTQCNHHQNSNGNLYITRANNSTLIWNHKRPTKIPSYPKKKEQEYLSTYFQYQRNKSIRTTEKNRQVDQPKKKKKKEVPKISPYASRQRCQKHILGKRWPPTALLVKVDIHRSMEPYQCFCLF